MGILKFTEKRSLDYGNYLGTKKGQALKKEEKNISATPITTNSLSYWDKY